MTPLDRADISVVVVNWNSGSDLARCLRSLAEYPPAASWEAIVVDNASTDASVEEGQRVAPGARWIVNRSNRGLAAANNQGLMAARGDVILLCNADIEFHPGSIDAFMTALERHPTASFIVPRVTFRTGGLQTTAGDLPKLWEAVLGRELQRRRRSSEPRGFCWDGWSHDEERRVGRAGDVCFAVRRRAAADIGLQDEAFPLDWEGIDWSARAAENGWEIWFCPNASVTHAAGSSTGKAPSARWVFATHAGMYRYFRKHSPGLRLFLRALFIARALVKIAAIWARTPVRHWSRSS